MSIQKYRKIIIRKIDFIKKNPSVGCLYQLSPFFTIHQLKMALDIFFKLFTNNTDSQKK